MSIDASTEPVLAADSRFFGALLDADLAALETLLGEDFVIVEVGTGDVHPRGAFLAAVRDGRVSFEAIVTDRESALVRIYGDVAVIVGQTAMTIVAAGGSRTVLASRYTHVFVAADGGWRLVSAQGTPIAGGG